MSIKSIFGENLKFYRKSKKLSQEQLSENVNISVKHLSSIERGLTFVSADLMEKLASSIDIPVFYFFVNSKEIIFNDVILNSLENIIEKQLTKSIENIKSELRKNNNC